MKGTMFASFSQTVHKFVPTPSQAELILAFFVFNNFQDFNTWQQIARTRIEYDYIEGERSFVCKISLKWQEKGLPMLTESAEAKSKKSSKKKALKKLIEALIYQGYIGHGFKEDNFVDKLPHRRKDSDDSSQCQIEEQTTKCKLKIRTLLAQGEIRQACQLYTLEYINQYWNYCLQQYSLDSCEKILMLLKMDHERIKTMLVEAIRGKQTSEIVHELEEIARETTKDCSGESVENIFENTLRNQEKGQSRSQVRPSFGKKQVNYHKQSKCPYSEDLADFMRYYQLQWCPWQPNPKEQPKITVSPLPSEWLIAHSLNPIPTQEQMLKYFHPIQGRKLFLKQKQPHSFLQLMDLELPKFEIDQPTIPVHIVEQLFDSLLFYAHDYTFCQQVFKLIEKYLERVQIGTPNSSPFAYKQKEQKYYLRNRLLVTAQFLYLLSKKVEQAPNLLSIEGMLTNLKTQQNLFTFNCKEPEEIVNRKLNKRNNFSEFDQMTQISLNEYVLLASKTTNRMCIGYVKQIVPALRQTSSVIKLILPEILTELPEPHPFTLYKLMNGKLYEKSTSAVLQTVRHCMDLLVNRTTLIWQPPTYSHISIIAQLLCEWLNCKVSVLIITLNVDKLFLELTNLGFKMLKVTSRLQEKYLPKHTILCSSPNAVCTDLLKNYAFTRVLIDEAHLMSQVLSLLAITKGCTHLYLIGDLFMPRISVHSPFCAARYMQVSLFQRLAQTQPLITFDSTCDNNNGDASILQWPNSQIYNMQLKCSNEQRPTPLIKGFPWPTQFSRVCFLHHECNKTSEEYLNEQAFICSWIVCQVVKSRFTKVENISCCAATAVYRMLLFRHCSELLRGLEVTDARTLATLVDRLVRNADGSVYERNDLIILMAGDDPQAVDYRTLNAVLYQARRGIVILGDSNRLRANEDWRSFMSWANHNKFVMRIDLQ